MGRGRPTKLTPELADRFVQALEEGNSIRRAAALTGITRSTAHAWIAQGEADDAPPEFSDFSDRVTRARTRVMGDLFNAAMQDAIGGVEIKRTVRPDGSEETQVTPPNGKVALQMMALLDPEEWLPRKAVELSGPGAGPVEVSHQADVVEGILARVRAARERRAARAANDAGGDGVGVGE
ncbi:hypothetical protein GCM10027187_40470 [Streptosporangium sandarakinum]|uniref:Uncharacterized protein n=1 Tax=Streptosporangium sandarakinum TaxID=1260955 RepID=A0A852V4G8_9ACTN|nr:hypothetical protein [Streptosporangium sandarakinum]NYF44622.1 hypothetical protein [Streptosporangium sandarakinum]